MGLKPGMTNNRKGRPPGKPNKVNRELRALLVEFVTGEILGIRKKYNKLTPRDQLRFLTDLAPYAISKLSSVDLEHKFEQLTDDQLETMTDKVLNAIKFNDNES